MKKSTIKKKAAPKKPMRAKSNTKTLKSTTVAARKQSKKYIVLGLLQREDGATLTELMDATDAP